MHRSRYAIPLLLVVSLSASAEDPVIEASSAASPEVASPLEDDAAANGLKWAREMNSDRYAAPPTEFRQGHVRAAMLPENSVQRTEDQFVVRFPGGAPVVTPAVHGGKVLVSAGFSGQEFYAFDAQTGALQWGRTLDDDGPSAAACDDGVCVFNTESCTVFALAANTGQLLWAWWMGDPMLAAPAVANGRVFTSYPAAWSVAGGKPVPPGATHAVASLDLRTGAIQWQRWIDSDVMSAPVAVGDEVHFTTFAGTVYTMAQADGEIRAVERGRATSAPTVVGNDLYFTQRSESEGEAARELLVKADKISRHTTYRVAEKLAPYLDPAVQSETSYSSYGVSLDAGNGFGGGAPVSANGTVSRLQSYQGSRVVNLGPANVSTMGDEVVSTDTRTGETRWVHKVDGDIASAGGFLAAPPAVAGGRLVIATLGGQVQVLDAASGAVQRTFDLGAPIRSQPVVHDGWIYVGTEDGRLIGLDTKDRTLTGWPQWGGNAARTGAAG
jgi:outer membrane protein assembly factor BamB